jgi:hypothetical protein
MKKYIFTFIQIAILITGNIWCYIANDRLLQPTTNIVMIFMIILFFIQNKTLER